MSFDVFISYSTKDAATAKAACAALEAEKIRCWMAPRDISPGAPWGASIVRAIDDCRVMVLIFSGNANDSKQVHREVNRAFDRGVTVVPLRIENVTPADALAYYLDTVHWLDALTPPLERALAQLTGSVRAFLTSAAAPAATGGEAVLGEAEAARAEDDARAEDERRLETAEAERRAATDAHGKADEVEGQRRAEAQRQRAADAKRRSNEGARRKQAEAERAKRAEPDQSRPGTRRKVLIGATSAIVMASAGLAARTYLRDRSIRTFKGHSGPVNSIAFSPDGRSALSGSEDTTLKLWDIAAGSEVRTLRGHLGSVSSVKFSPDGNAALSGGGGDGSIKLWDVASGKTLLTFTDKLSAVRSVAFSPDGKTAISGSIREHMGEFKLWETATGKEIRNFIVSGAFGNLPPIRSVAFAPDGHTGLAGGGNYGSDDGAFMLWNIATGELVRNFFANQRHSFVSSVAVTPDGRSALSNDSFYSTVREGEPQPFHLWAVSTGTYLRTFEGHQGYVNSVVFAPDGMKVLSGSVDGTVKIWETATARQLRSFKANQGAVNAVVFSPDGHTALSAGKDGTIKQWDLSGTA